MHIQPVNQTRAREMATKQSETLQTDVKPSIDNFLHSLHQCATYVATVSDILPDLTEDLLPSPSVQGAFIGKRKALLKTNELREKRRRKIEENEVAAHKNHKIKPQPKIAIPATLHPQVLEQCDGQCGGGSVQWLVLPRWMDVSKVCQHFAPCIQQLQCCIMRKDDNASGKRP